MSGLLLACLACTALVAAGASATYLTETRQAIWARIAMGAPLGFTVLGVASLPMLFAFGMTGLAVTLALLVSLAPLMILCRPAMRRQLSEDVAAALQPPSPAVAVPLALMAVILILTFHQAILMTGDGIGTGSLANRLDLTLHLSIITSFLEGQNVPPVHPGFAGVPLTYPFITDLDVALLMRIGATLRDAMFLENAILAISLVALLYYWTLELVSSRAAAVLCPPIVLLGSGLGWLVMLKDARHAAGTTLQFLDHLPHSYTVNTANLQWGDLTTIMLVPQRSLDLGLPLALIVMMLWWRALSAPREREPEAARTMIFAGAVAGLTPLAHTYTFLVAMTAAAALALLFPRWRLWLRFFGPAALLAVPQLLWITRGSPLHASRFLAWAPGWSKGPEPLAWFWFKNTGLFLPLLAAALVAPRLIRREGLRRFYLPFVAFLIAPNLLRLAPRLWDNNKILIYWYVASAPLVALALAAMFRRGRLLAACAAALFLSLTLSGALDAWRVIRGTASVALFDRTAVAFAHVLERETPPDAVLVRAPTSNHPAVLSGRRSVLGYIAQAQLHGFDTTQREADVRCIYSGCPHARQLLDAYKVGYIVVGPPERQLFEVNDRFLGQFEHAGVAGTYTLLRVRGE